MTGLTMAKPKPTGKPKGRPKGEKRDEDRKIVGVRATSEWRAWVERLATRDRITVSGLIDQVLARYAKETGFEGPPER